MEYINCNNLICQTITLYEECRPLGGYAGGYCKNRHFGGMNRLHHQGDKNRRARNVSSN
jgi:hypothetical protein